MAKLTILNETPEDAPVKLIYGDFILIDGINESFFKTKGELFLIAQVGTGVMCLFSLSERDGTYDAFNRITEPVQIDGWNELTTESIKEYLPWKNIHVTKVKAEITITITK